MKTTHSILLGFDFGMKRIGVAVGQTVTKTARPLHVVAAHKGIPEWKNIDQLVKSWLPDGMIVGIPFNMDGTEQALTLAARQFAESLVSRFQLPVYEIDERLSTVAARDQLFTQGGYKALQKQSVDCMAAQLILQNWLAQLTE